MTLECRYSYSSGGCLKSFNTASPRWRPFKWDIRFVVLKLDAFFPLVILAEKLPDWQRHVHKWWRNECDTSWESLHSESGWISDKSDWLIDWFISKRNLSDLDIGFQLLIGAKKRRHSHPYWSIIYLSGKYRASLVISEVNKKKSRYHLKQDTNGAFYSRGRLTKKKKK